MESGMKKVLEFFVRDGKPTVIGVWVTTLTSVIAIALVIYFRVNNWFGWAILASAGVLLVISGTAAHAATMGAKPFTNDPLGWRKAKATYQDEESLPAKKPGFIARLFGRK